MPVLSLVSCCIMLFAATPPDLQHTPPRASNAIRQDPQSGTPGAQPGGESGQRRSPLTDEERLLLDKAEKRLAKWSAQPPSNTEWRRTLDRTLLALGPPETGIFGMTLIQLLSDFRCNDKNAQPDPEHGANLVGNVYELCRRLLDKKPVTGAYQEDLRKLGLDIGLPFAPHVGVVRRPDGEMTNVFAISLWPERACRDMVQFGFPTLAFLQQADAAFYGGGTMLEAEATVPIGIRYRLQYVVIVLAERYGEVMKTLRGISASGDFTELTRLAKKHAPAMKKYLDGKAGMPADIRKARKFYLGDDTKVDEPQLAAALWMAAQIDRLEAVWRIVFTQDRQVLIGARDLQSVVAGRFGDLLRILQATGEDVPAAIRAMAEQAARGFEASDKGATDLIQLMTQAAIEDTTFFQQQIGRVNRQDRLVAMVRELAVVAGESEASAGEQALAFRQGFDNRLGLPAIGCGPVAPSFSRSRVSVRRTWSIATATPTRAVRPREQLHRNGPTEIRGERARRPRQPARVKRAGTTSAA